MHTKHYIPNNIHQRFERTWDPDAAEKSGRGDFVHDRVKSNRKEAAYDIFYSRGFRLPGFYQEVSARGVSDASDWTSKDKERFRSAVFEHHEDMREVSKAIGKPVEECITHYIVRFKRTKSYKSVKRSMRRKASVEEANKGKEFVCDRCGKGGMLVACDTCEAHYHLPCAIPPLEKIPDGNWSCGNCKRTTRTMLVDSSQDEASMTDQQQQQQPADASVEEASMQEGDRADADNGKLKSPPPEAAPVKGYHDLSSESDNERSGDTPNQSTDFANLAGTKHRLDGSEQTNGDGPSHKKMRIEGTNGGTSSLPMWQR